MKANGVKGKSLKDAPKRNKSAYMFFCAENRAEVSKDFKKLGDISKELSRRWADVSEAERKVYDEMAAADKLRYENEKLGMTAGKGGKKKSTSRKKGTKSPAKKKRGPSAYMLFCSAHRNDIVDENGNKLPLGETTKRLAVMWKNCDEDTRARFTAEAEKQKALA